MSQMIKVGAFATVCLIVLAVLIWKVKDINPFQQHGRHLSAVFPTVAGLDDKSAVRMAGVRIGRVDGIGLAGDGRSAEVKLLLEQPVPLTQGASARIANLGLLGDKYVEIVPGPPAAPALPEGAVLRGTSPVTFDEAMAKLDSIGSSIEKVTGSFGGGNLGGNVNSLVEDLRLTSAEIRALVAENRANVASTVRNFDFMAATLAKELPRISADTQRALDQVSGLIAENRGDVSASMSNIRELTSHLQTSVDNLNKITGEVASGQGTVGKLINSDEAYKSAVSTLDSIKSGVESLSGTIGAIQRFKMDLDLQGYLLQKQQGTFSRSHSLFDILIDPQDSQRLYKVGIAATPNGTYRTRIDHVTYTDPTGHTFVTTVNDQVTEDKLGWTALLGFHTATSERWSDVRFWGGLIESKGGVQVEYPINVDLRRPNWPLNLELRRPIWLSFEAFDFSRPQNQRAHLRFTARWQFHPNLYVLGGWDDPLEQRSLFFGAGIRWKDDNLKYLLGSASRF
jgi:phospholipid/cholesterol/gamma-HCH transport system substrate-binding protein